MREITESMIAKLNHMYFHNKYAKQLLYNYQPISIIRTLDDKLLKLCSSKTYETIITIYMYLLVNDYSYKGIVLRFHLQNLIFLSRGDSLLR